MRRNKGRKIFAFAALIFLCRNSTGTSASVMDGSWSVTVGCNKCASSTGETFDEFSLDLWSNGSRLCGFHLATARLGDRVDESTGDKRSIIGKVVGNNAVIAFHSAFGGSGHAELRLIGNKLHWHETDHEGTSWLWDEAILTRQSTKKVVAPTCAVDNPG